MDDFERRRELRRQKREEMRVEVERVTYQRNDDDEEEAARERRRRARQERQKLQREDGDGNEVNSQNSITVEENRTTSITNTDLSADDEAALLERLAKREERRQKRQKEAMERQKEYEPTMSIMTNESFSISKSTRNGEEKIQENDSSPKVNDSDLIQDKHEAKLIEKVERSIERNDRKEEEEEQVESEVEVKEEIQEEAPEEPVVEENQVEVTFQIKNEEVPEANIFGGGSIVTLVTEEDNEQEKREAGEREKMEEEAKLESEEREKDEAERKAAEERERIEEEARREAEEQEKAKREEEERERIESERKAAEEQERIEAEQREKERAEAKEREHQERLEKERKAAEKKAEDERIKAEKKRAEEERKKQEAEEKRKAEEKRAAEEKKKAEEKRAAEEKARLEAKKKEEEKKKKPDDKQVKDKKVEEKIQPGFLKKQGEDKENKFEAKKDEKLRPGFKKDEVKDEKTRRGKEEVKANWDRKKGFPESKVQNGEGIHEVTPQKLKHLDKFGGLKGQPNAEDSGMKVEAGKKLDDLRRRRGESETGEFDKLKQKQQESAAELEELKKRREERRKLMEEEEQRKKQGEAERKAREEEDKKRMKEEIERRRAEAAEKRQKLPDDGLSEEKKPFKCFTPKGSSFKIEERAEFLNKSAQKSVKSPQPAAVSKIDSRLEQYTSAIGNNKSAKPAKAAPSDLPLQTEGVRNIKSMWEKGNVFSSPGTVVSPNKETAGLKIGVSSRINEWLTKTPETNKTSSAKPADLRPGDVSGKRNLWEKQPEKASTPAK